NNEKLTNEKFITANNTRFLKTGDLAKRDENGEYIIIGRSNDQINIRGIRIEPGEIENNISKSFGLKKSLATVKKINNESILFLYFTTKDSLTDKELNKLKEDIHNDLKKKLVNFMVPQIYIYLDEFPKTSSGKIKIMDLPNPLNSDLLIEEIILPETDLEKELFNFASEILGFDDFGVTNSFFSIGFTSLSLIRFISKIFNEYGIELKINNLFVNNSIRNISNQINELPKLKRYTNDKEYYYLTPQQLTYFEQNQENCSPLTDNINFYFKFNKNIDPFELRDSLIKAIHFNPDIKIFFQIEKNNVCQKMNETDSFNIGVYKKKITAEVYKEFIKPFNLFKFPLFNFEIYYYNNETSLLFSIHHIIFDYVSLINFFNDVFRVYNNEKIKKKEFTYLDYSIDLEDSGKDEIIKMKNYIKDKTKNFPLSSYLLSTQLKFNHEDKYFYSIIKCDNENIKFFCEQNNINHDILFLSATVLALSKFFHKNNLFLEYAFNGRDKSRYVDLVGLFRRKIPLFFDIDFKSSIRSIIHYTNKNIKDGINIQPNNLSEKLMNFFNLADSPKLIYEFRNDESSNDFFTFFPIFPDESLLTLKNQLVIRVKKDEQFTITIDYDNAYFSKIEIQTIIQLIDSFLLFIISKPLETTFNDSKYI
ncbi:MAG: condensation domain-containing protein, partial [Methanobrevibacter sp.]|nr:condensation domain-containing protein [Methanobrevibacter sp.]